MTVERADSIGDHFAFIKKSVISKTGKPYEARKKEQT